VRQADSANNLRLRIKIDAAGASDARSEFSLLKDEAA